MTSPLPSHRTQVMAQHCTRIRKLNVRDTRQVRDAGGYESRFRNLNLLSSPSTPLLGSASLTLGLRWWFGRSGKELPFVGVAQHITLWFATPPRFPLRPPPLPAFVFLFHFISTAASS